MRNTRAVAHEIVEIVGNTQSRDWASVRSLTLQRRAHAVTRHHVQDALGFFTMIGHEMKPIFLHDHGYDEQHFHHRHVHAHAHSRTTAEREIRMSGPPQDLLRLETLWVERLRVLPE